MGIYSDGNIYGITWIKDEEEQETKYEKKYTQALTDEQRQEIYTDFLRLIPEKDRPLYHYRVYTRVTYTPDTEDSYFFTWFPFDLKHVLVYLVEPV